MPDIEAIELVEHFFIAAIGYLRPELLTQRPLRETLRPRGTFGTQTRTYDEDTIANMTSADSIPMPPLELRALVGPTEPAGAGRSPMGLRGDRETNRRGNAST